MLLLQTPKSLFRQRDFCRFGMADRALWGMRLLYSGQARDRILQETEIHQRSESNSQSDLCKACYDPS